MAELFPSIQETIAAYRAKTLKPSAVATELLARLDKENLELNAYLRTYTPEIVAAAKKADAAYAAGTARPLEGIFVGIKDNLLVSGTLTGSASKMLEGYVAPYTGTAVGKPARCRRDHGRKNQHGRICHGFFDRKFGLWCDQESERSFLRPGRLVRRLGRGGCGRTLPHRPGIGYRRLHSPGRPRFAAASVLSRPTGSVSRYGLMSIGLFTRRDRPACPNSVSDARTVFNAIRGADERDATSHDIKGAKKLAGRGIA